MYKCKDCGRYFENPRAIRDKVPYGEEMVDLVTDEVCPYCGGPFGKFHVCELCGDDFFESDFDDVCPSCINIVANRFSKMLKENFTPFEIEILNVAYDGRNLE